MFLVAMYIAHNMYGHVDIAQPLIEQYQKDLEGFRSLEDKMMQCTLVEFGLIRVFLLDRGYDPGITFRMLEAHGHSMPPGRYSYVDYVGQDIALFPVDEWVEKYDGHYDTLFVNCCNPGGVELQASKSLLVHPMSNIPGNEVFQIIIENKKSDILRIALPTNPNRKYKLDVPLVTIRVVS